MAGSKRLGEVLVEMGYVDPRVVQAALEEQRRSPRRLGKVLIEMGVLTEERLVRALSLQLGLDICDPVAGPVGGNARALLPAEVALRCRVIPMSLRRDEGGQTLVLATADPLDRAAIDHLRVHVGPMTRIRWMLASEGEIELALNRHYGAGDARSQTKHATPGAAPIYQAPATSTPPAPRYAPAPVITGVPISGPRPSSPAPEEDAFEVVSLASSMRELDVRGRAPSAPPGRLKTPIAAARAEGAHLGPAEGLSPPAPHIPSHLMPSSELPIDPVRAPFAQREHAYPPSTGTGSLPMAPQGTGSLPMTHGTGSLGHGTGSLGHATGPLGHGTGSLGHGTGSLGHGTGPLGHGTGSLPMVQGTADLGPARAPATSPPRPLAPRAQNVRAPANMPVPSAASAIPSPVVAPLVAPRVPTPSPPPAGAPVTAPVAPLTSSSTLSSAPVAPLTSSSSVSLSAPPLAPLTSSSTVSSPPVVAPRASPTPSASSVDGSMSPRPAIEAGPVGGASESRGESSAERLDALDVGEDSDGSMPILTLDDVVESIPPPGLSITDGLSGLEVRPKPAPRGAPLPEEIRVADVPALMIDEPDDTPEPVEVQEAPRVRRGGAAAIADSLLPPLPSSSWGDLVPSLTGSIDLTPEPSSGDFEIPIDEGPMVDGVSSDLPRLGPSRTGDLARASRTGDLARASRTGDLARASRTGDLARGDLSNAPEAPSTAGERSREPLPSSREVSAVQRVREEAAEEVRAREATPDEAPRTAREVVEVDAGDAAPAPRAVVGAAEPTAPAEARNESEAASRREPAPGPEGVLEIEPAEDVDSAFDQALESALGPESRALAAAPPVADPEPLDEDVLEALEPLEELDPPEGLLAPPIAHSPQAAPALERPALERPALERPALEAALLEAPAFEPRELEPVEIEPVELGPVELGPGEFEPRVFEPGEFESGAFDARESEAREPEARESEAREPEARESEARESEARESEARESELRESERQDFERATLGALALEGASPAAPVSAPGLASGALEISKVRAILEGALLGAALEPEASRLLLRVLVAVLSNEGLLDDERLARALARLSSR